MQPTNRNQTKKSGGTIESVAAGSLGERIGLRPGDRILAIDGNPIRDVLDYQFYCAEEQVEITVERAGSEQISSLRASGSLGIEFAEPTFDGLRRCNNRCLFCFVGQLPGGLRRSLYVKDDDLRYSFLYGNFATLTNLTEADWRRLAEQRIGPLHVSVHATDTALRRLLLGNPHAPDVVPQLRRLAALGISFHAQIVLCPGINDGAALDQTVADLAVLYPRLCSIGIVPVAVGESASVREPRLRPFGPAQAASAVQQIEPHQRAFRKQHGVTLVHLSDEFYLLAGKPFPSARMYDGFVQYENGIGMARSMLDDVQGLKKRARPAAAAACRRFAVACGRLIAPLMVRILDDLGNVYGWRFDLVPVDNRLFGKHVTVSGLLGGEEVIQELAGATTWGAVFLPRSMLDAEGRWTLDGIRREEFEKRLGVPVRFVSTIAELVDICDLREVKGCVA